MSKKTTIKPLGERVLIKQYTFKEKTTNGGIILPMDESNPHDRQEQLTGKIIELGYEVLPQHKLKIGMLVRYAKHAHTDVPEMGEDFILVNRKDIQAIIIEGKQS